MRENRQSGSEGGEGLTPLAYPYQRKNLWQTTLTCPADRTPEGLLCEVQWLAKLTDPRERLY